MQSHKLNVLGLEISFKAEADPARIQRACKLLEQRAAKITRNGVVISKEKLLTFISIGLADDLLRLEEEQEKMQTKVAELLNAIEEKTS